MIIKKERDKKYMVLGEPEKKDSFATQMIIENDIPGFITCKKETFNGEFYLYYDVTGKSALSDYSKKIQADMLERMLLALLSCIDTLDTYFLSSEGISFHPDTIFEEKGEWYFCYFTDVENESIPAITFCEELLTKVDQKDERAVIISYQLYQAVRKNTNTLRNILYDLLYGNEQDDEETSSFCYMDKREERQITNEEMEEEENEQQAALETNEINREHKTETNRKIDYPTLIIFAVLAVGSCIMITFFSIKHNIKTMADIFIYREGLLCTCFFVIGTAGIIGSIVPSLLSKLKKNKPQHIGGEEVFEIPFIDKI